MHSLPPLRIQNIKTQHDYTLQSADLLTLTVHSYEEIAAICNQPDVYKLFGDRFQGRPYSVSDAEGFLRWAHEGWAKRHHFVFIVTTEDGRVAAALDVKSADLESAEIGYWCCAKERGITGVATRTMIEWARENGFKELFARPINERSTSLLLREGFKERDLGPQKAGDSNPALVKTYFRSLRL